MSDELDEIEKTSDEAKKKLDQIDEDFELRLKEFDDRTSAAKKVREQKEHHIRVEQAKDRESSKGLAVGLSAAYTIIGTPVGFWLIGKLVDNMTNSPNKWSPGFMLVGAISGVAIAIWMSNRMNSKS